MTEIQPARRPPAPRLSARAKSLHTLNVRDLDVSRILTRRSTQLGFFEIFFEEEDETNSPNTDDVLYKITDIVLVICGIVFIISAIASITLWIIGLD